MADLNDELLARVSELMARAERGELTYTHFLTPREQKILADRMGGALSTALPLGGYADAERKRLYFLPPYLAELEEPYRSEAIAQMTSESLCAVSIKASGYRSLSHRDFLGAILHLGVERDRIGDLCLLSPFEAVLFCDRLMAGFFGESLTRVGSDAVRVSPFLPPEGFDGGKQYLPVSDTVASPRADAVVAALANLSRERAQALFREGRVEIDYEPEEKYDRPVAEGSVIVIRGVGKFTLRALSDKTRKGRYRLLADKHV